MRKKLIPVLLALVFALATVSPAFAITGGVPDGNGHPYGALLLVPGYTFCSGTLIDEDVVLTAGHCTSFWEALAAEDEEGDFSVYVTFDPYASVDPDTWQITGGTWYTSDTFITHPDYVEAEWPFTADYGLVILDEPVVGIEPAELPEPNLLDELIGSTGQTTYRFNDVGYGQSGVNNFQGPPTRNFEFIRKVSTQRFNPSVGAVGTQHPLWLILGNNPSANHGAGCGGDSGSGIFVEGTDTIVAVHTGGYRLGYNGTICGRITSLNHRIDVPEILDWILQYVD